MTGQQRGFTMIELVMVIVIIGIMTAVALPKFVNIKQDAHRETLAGVAGALSSAAAINYGARQVDSAKGNAVGNCTDLANALQGGLPNGYFIESLLIPAGDIVTCQVRDTTSGDITEFTGLGTL